MTATDPEAREAMRALRRNGLVDVDGIDLYASDALFLGGDRA